MVDPRRRKRRYQIPEHTSTGPRNRPMRSYGDPLPPITGRRRRDWRHDLFQDQIGCTVLILVVTPAAYFLGMMLGFW